MSIRTTQSVYKLYILHFMVYAVSHTSLWVLFMFACTCLLFAKLNYIFIPAIELKHVTFLNAYKSRELATGHISHILVSLNYSIFPVFSSHWISFSHILVSLNFSFLQFNLTEFIVSIFLFRSISLSRILTSLNSIFSLVSSHWIYPSRTLASLNLSFPYSCDLECIFTFFFFLTTFIYPAPSPHCIHLSRILASHWIARL